MSRLKLYSHFAFCFFVFGNDWEMLIPRGRVLLVKLYSRAIYSEGSSFLWALNIENLWLVPVVILWFCQILSCVVCILAREYCHVHDESLIHHACQSQAKRMSFLTFKYILFKSCAHSVYLGNVYIYQIYIYLVVLSVDLMWVMTIMYLVRVTELRRWPNLKSLNPKQNSSFFLSYTYLFLFCFCIVCLFSVCSPDITYIYIHIIITRMYRSRFVVSDIIRYFTLPRWLVKIHPRMILQEDSWMAVLLLTMS